MYMQIHNSTVIILCLHTYTIEKVYIIVFLGGDMIVKSLIVFWKS